MRAHRHEQGLPGKKRLASVTNATA
jgi:hypothetical protein